VPLKAFAGFVRTLRGRCFGCHSGAIPAFPGIAPIMRRRLLLPVVPAHLS